MPAPVFSPKSLYRVLAALLLLMVSAATGTAAPLLPHYLAKVTPAELVAGADSFGPLRKDIPVVPVIGGGKTLAWAFLTSDFVGTTGYSGKPIHIIAAVSPDAVLTGAKLIKHSEPIVLVGIPEARIRKLISGYAGTDLKAEAVAPGSSHKLDIVSGATVTVMVIDDSVIRAGLKVAHALGLGGLPPETGAAAPKFTVSTETGPAKDWAALTAEGAVRRLTLDVGQINQAFADTGDAKAISRPEPGEPTDTFVDLNLALVSTPEIGTSLLGAKQYRNLTDWLQPGEQAILVMNRGHYSFKGSGYVRGGIFDRITLIQGDRSVRFRDSMHRRLGALSAAGAPSFTEIDLFRIPADAGFEPTAPFALQLLVHRIVGPIEKRFLTFELGYRLPEAYLVPVAAPAKVGSDADAEAAAKAALWHRVWRQRTPEIVGLLAMLAVLTGAFFFQMRLTRSARRLYWFRMSFLTATLVFLGWYANAQLSVVNLMALAGALKDGFTWDAFLLDPLVFILWFSVAAALIFWGRGAYCGWLCPFGALQELTNEIAKFFKLPQITLPWGLHERLWALKYLIFLALFGMSLVSIPMAEHYAEVEPFKTAIILKFVRPWPFVAYALLVLLPGLFIDRFYCRYLCPLGGALAIPARMRMFAWLRRYHECGHPCQTCANECPVDAIHPTGEINPNECVNCLHCQMLYQSEAKCPVIIRQLKRRAAVQSPGDARKRETNAPTGA